MWLAERGWRVTAVDISPVALERAARRAAEACESTADRITWQQADILAWTPPPAQFDLVSAHFVHLRKPKRDVVYSRPPERTESITAPRLEQLCAYCPQSHSHRPDRQSGIAKCAIRHACAEPSAQSLKPTQRVMDRRHGSKAHGAPCTGAKLRADVACRSPRH
jgi:SAM-dependent methyltransferase